jgi:CO/xanthine dehydrogenase FAD-binding subunit
MEYVKPSDVREAIAVLESSHGVILAGGTDVCVYKAEGLLTPETLIDISGIDALQGIQESVDDRGEPILQIGACTTIAEVASSKRLPSCLRQGAKALGSPQIRNLGTLGGNICNASPCGDTLPPLLCLDARFVLVSARGERRVESEAFFTGPKQTVLQPGELLVRVEIPAAASNKVSAFRMIGNRKGQAISQANASVSLSLAKGRMAEVRVAVGSVAPIPLRLRALEEWLAGKRLEEVSVDAIRDAVRTGIRPIDDVRSSARYRQEVTVALVFDCLAECSGSHRGDREGGGGC